MRKQQKALSHLYDPKTLKGRLAKKRLALILHAGVLEKVKVLMVRGLPQQRMPQAIGLHQQKG